ncbi:hypothetical protein Tco_0657766 [Tanacetum coccineum]
MLRCPSSAERGECHVYLIGTDHVSMVGGGGGVSGRVWYMAVVMALPKKVNAIIMFDYKLPVIHKKGTYNGRNGGALEEESQGVRNTLHLASAFFQLASKVDVFPGSDCHVAYEAAMKYGGKVLLGDRPADVRS